MQQIIPAEFNGTPIQIIDHDGHKWLTADQAGRCLGYDESNARNRVTKIFERHADEFSEEDTCAVNLTAQGQARTTRVFSATGCIKLGFFASTPRAKDFRNWASSVLAGKPAPAVRNVAVDLNLAREIGQLKDMVNAQNQVIISLYQRIDTAQRGQIRAVTSLLSLQKRQAAADAKALIIELDAVGVARHEIARRTGKTLNHIRQVVWQARQANQGELPLGEAA